MKKKTLSTCKYDRNLLLSVCALCALGLITLFSSALGELQSLSNFIRIFVIQLAGLGLGFFAIYLAVTKKKIDYRCLYKKYYALYFFMGCIVFQLLVFSPIGVERKGAQRWIDLGFTTVQPSEFLKIALVLFLASLLVGFKKEFKEMPYLLGLLGISAGLTFVLMLLIRDKGTLIIMAISVFAMLVASQARKSHLLLLVFFAGSSLGLFLGFTDDQNYAKQRILSFMGVVQDSQGQSYQVNQAIATVGSGQIMGKGYGQSVQKHKYLPETLNDSIFAIYAEEWGFIGSVLLVFLYVFFIWTGLRIAKRARDAYGRYVAIGLTVLIASQAFYNIAALIKLVPLSGMPLIFVSKGGSSLLASLLMVAILLNISRFVQKNVKTLK